MEEPMNVPHEIANVYIKSIDANFERTTKENIYESTLTIRKYIDVTS